MIFIGIDPGAKGAIVAIDSSGTVCLKEIMPEDPKNLFNYLKSFQLNCENIVVGFEKAHAMPGQGVTSMFTYGVGWGRIDGFLIALELKYELIPPKTWTKAMHAGANKSKEVTAKQRSLEVVRRLFPEVDLRATERSKVAHEGIVDALLIAEFVRRKHGK